MTTHTPALRRPVGGLWAIRRDALDWIARQDLAPYADAYRASLVPGQSPAQPPAYPDPSKRGPGYDLVNGVAVVPVYGLIYRHSTYLNDLYAWAFGGVSVDSLAASLRAATADPAVKSVLFTFDSPGGTVAGVSELAGMIRGAASVKPVAAYAENLCCSAAYELAAACGEVTAAPWAELGSLGVVMAFLDDTAFQENIGIIADAVVSEQTPLKWLDPATPEGRGVCQKAVNAACDLFIADVARFRNTTPEDVMANYGKGDAMIAAQAKRVGIIDKLGTVEDALRKLSGQNRVRLAAHKPAAAVRLRVRAG